MKKLIYSIAAVLLLFSCKKEDAPVGAAETPYLHTVFTQLKDSLSPDDYRDLDTMAVYLTNSGKNGNYSLRIGFRGKPIAEDFLLARTDEAGTLRIATIVHMDNTTPSFSYQFSGAVRMRSLSGKITVQSDIVDGRIVQLHSGRRLVLPSGTKTVTVLPAPDADWLPEVIVVGYSGGGTPTPYISLDVLLGGVGNGDLGINSGGSPGDAGSGGNEGGGSSGSGSTPPASSEPSAPPEPYSPLDPGSVFQHNLGGGLTTVEPLSFEQEYIYQMPIVNVTNYFKCFDLVPSEGASYTIQLCADVPSNNDPNRSMTFSAGISAGHTFLVVTKSGGGVSISQAFGFYPASTLSAWNPMSAVGSVIRDNSNAEINASITMTMNPDQFNTIRAAAIALSQKPYQLDKSNCSDYALGVFNAARTNPLTVDPYMLTQAGIFMGNGLSSPPVTVPITNSPQMIYEKLSAIKANGAAEASNIQLNLTNGLLSPYSHGECN
ncbi:MAG TPA: hypothetical protein VGN00_30025 [Puia sp.]|jgi:hypothetical protein